MRDGLRDELRDGLRDGLCDGLRDGLLDGLCDGLREGCMASLKVGKVGTFPISQKKISYSKYPRDDVDDEEGRKSCFKFA